MDNRTIKWFGYVENIKKIYWKELDVVKTEGMLRRSRGIGLGNLGSTEPLVSGNMRGELETGMNEKRSWVKEGGKLRVSGD